MTPDLTDARLRRRYERVSTLAHRLHAFFAGSSLVLIALFLIRFRVWWLFLLVFLTYIALNRLLFSRWSKRAIQRRITAATSGSRAEIRKIESIAGLHQVAYHYDWEGRRYRFTDFLPASEANALHPGQLIDIYLDPFRPRQSYIAPPKERIVK